MNRSNDQWVLERVSAPNPVEDGDAEVYYYRWCNWGQAQPHWFEGTREALAKSLPSHSEAWLVIPSADIHLTQMSFQPEERKHLAKMLPYQQEEQLLDDVDECHFALATPEDNTVELGSLSKSVMAEFVVPLQEVGIHLRHCVADVLMLPWRENQWTLFWRGEYHSPRIDLRYGQNLGCSLEPELTEIALPLLLTENGAPENLKVFAANEADLNQLLALIPGSLDVEVESFIEPWEMALELPGASNAPLNLMQGEFAPSLPLKLWWLEWRQVAVAAVAAVLLFMGVNGISYFQLQQEREQLLAEREKAYRSVVASGELVDPEAQLRTQLKGFQSSTDGAQKVTALLSHVAPVLKQNKQVLIESLFYQSRGGELRINVQADAFQPIERLRSELEKQNLKAELLNSSSQGGKQQARLKLTFSKRGEV